MLDRNTYQLRQDNESCDALRFPPTPFSSSIKKQLAGTSKLNDPRHILKQMEEHRGFCSSGLQQTLRDGNEDAKCLKHNRFREFKNGVDWSLL